MANDEKLVAPYVSFQTFISAVESLGEHVVPDRIDRSVLNRFSGTRQSEVLRAFQFLGLTDGEGHTQPRLHELVKAGDDRQQVLRQIIEERYADVIRLGLSSMSPDQLNEAFGQYGVQGDTRRKAITFFLHACQAAAIPVSPWLVVKKAPAKTGNRKKRAKPPEETLKPARKTGTKMPPSSADTMTIKLQDGGEVSLSVTMNPFLLTEADREFVFDLIDRLHRYKAENTGG